MLSLSLVLWLKHEDNHFTEKFWKYTISIFYHGMLNNVRISMATGNRVVVKALVSRKWDPSLNPGLDDTYGLSFLLVLSLSQSVFSEFSPAVTTNTSQVLFDKKSKGHRFPDGTAVMFFPQYKDIIYLFRKTWLFPGYLNGTICTQSVKIYLLSWSVLTTIGSLAGPSPFTVDANTVI